MGPLIPLLISGGASLVSSLFGSHTAKKASEQQQASAQRAMDQLGPIYQQGRADLNPYAQAGAQGLTSLTSLLGLPGMPTGAAAAPLNDFGQPAVAKVFLRAPTGETQAVPAHQAEFYIARGATRLPNPTGGTTIPIPKG